LQRVDQAGDCRSVADVVGVNEDLQPFKRIGYTRRKTRVPVVVAVANSLRKALDALTRKHVTIINTEYGKPFTVDGYSGWMRRGQLISPHDLIPRLDCWMIQNGGYRLLGAIFPNGEVHHGGLEGHSDSLHPNEPALLSQFFCHPANMSLRVGRSTGCLFLTRGVDL